MSKNEISFSERRLRQVRMAGAVFGKVSEITYPATREGFKAFWRHARILNHIRYDVQWRRALPSARWEGNLFRPQRNLSGKARLEYAFPDRVWVATDFPLWSFRYHLLTDAAFKVLRDERGDFNAKKHHDACLRILKYHTGPNVPGTALCNYCVQSRIVTTKDEWGHTRILGGHGE